MAGQAEAVVQLEAGAVVRVAQLEAGAVVQLEAGAVVRVAQQPELAEEAVAG